MQIAVSGLHGLTGSDDTKPLAPPCAPNARGVINNSRSKTDWRRTLKYNVPDMIEKVWLHENKADHNDFIKRDEKDLKFDKILDNEQIERMKLLLFYFSEGSFGKSQSS